MTMTTEYNCVLERAERDQKIGVSVRPSCLTVTGTDGYLLERITCGEILKRGDRILTVNGKSSPRDAMAELRSAMRVWVVFRHPTLAEAQKIIDEESSHVCGMLCDELGQVLMEEDQTAVCTILENTFPKLCTALTNNARTSDAISQKMKMVLVACLGGTVETTKKLLTRDVMAWINSYRAFQAGGRAGSQMIQVQNVIVAPTTGAREFLIEAEDMARASEKSRNLSASIAKGLLRLRRNGEFKLNDNLTAAIAGEALREVKKLKRQLDSKGTATPSTNGTSPSSEASRPVRQ